MATDSPNEVRRRTRRAGKAPATRPPEPKVLEVKDGEPLNSIRPTRSRPRAVPEAKAAGRKSTTQPSTDERPRDRAREMPDDIRKRFTQVGNQYFFPDGTRAFTDRGGRITSPSENTEVIRSLVAIAEARGWSDLIVKGTERFRREAWYQARQAGLEVRGYRPSAYDEARLARSLNRASESRVAEGAPRPGEAPAESARQNRDPDVPERGRREVRSGASRLHIGRLADHGEAPYRHDPRNGLSYFVRLETPDGEREIWGVDLHRALKESLTRPQIGDEIGLRAVRRDAVTLQAPTRDEEGKVTGTERVAAHRNRWIVEQRGLFAERAQAAQVVRDPQVDPKLAVKGHPELAGTFLKIRASELAAKAIRDPEDRTRFVALVRRALADEIARGEPLTPVRLKDPVLPRKVPRAIEPDRVPAR